MSDQRGSIINIRSVLHHLNVSSRTRLLLARFLWFYRAAARVSLPLHKVRRGLGTGPEKIRALSD